MSERNSDKKLNLAYDIEKLRQRYGLIKYTLTLALVAWIAFIVYKAVTELAGKTTIANLIAELAINDWLAYAVIAVLTVGNVGQAKLRKWSDARLHKRIKQLEQGYDPNRSSSKLLEDGSTRPEDL
jgi:hypothetical protein